MALRKELGLTQEKFADRLSMKRNTIANYEIGRNEPIDAVVSLICKEFNVSEEWLRTGTGEMFKPLPEED
ncbi:helix-turn-helix domain-containing protein, partial [Pseudomonas aeruginosa]|nr:helix-turn-helix domain-containing protein [Pseudomonas aeruginosa]